MSPCCTCALIRGDYPGLFEFIEAKTPLLPLRSTLDWRKAAQQARKLLFPNEVFAEFLVDVEEMREVASQLGWAITIIPLQRVDGTEDQPAAA